jgi:hypothetical protein
LKSAWRGVLLGGLMSLLGCAALRAQDNYEIQVYPSETVAPGKFFVELHSNFAFQGEREVIDGVLPTEHALHETVECTFGFSSWFETGFYVFTSARSGEGWQWVGDHIRPRVRVPESWNWPVGVSLSAEFGYQRHEYSQDTWTLEIRPIVDKKLARWYFSFNPTFDKSVRGANASGGFEFSPDFKASYDASLAVALGLEYYGALGPVAHLDRLSTQQHQVGPAVDLNVSPDWELNFGALFGLTGATDRFIFKVIIGRRFNF